MPITQLKKLFVYGPSNEKVGQIEDVILGQDGKVVAYLNRCVHVPTEMDWQEGEFLDNDRRFIMCSIHGAVYDPLTGQCLMGPCNRGRLTKNELTEREGQVFPRELHEESRPVVVLLERGELALENEARAGAAADDFAHRLARDPEDGTH